MEIFWCLFACVHVKGESETHSEGDKRSDNTEQDGVEDGDV